MKIVIKTTIMLFLINLILYSCKTGNMSKEEIKKAINSDDNQRIMDAVYLVGEKKDTSFLEELFKLSYDPRISHQQEFLGMSIHQACMGAFKQITNQPPPNKISYRVDTVNIAFYRKLLQK
jgi:hypothetical protein